MPGDRRRGGRPKNGEPVSLSYRITAGIEHHPKVLADERRILGRFILATNDPELSADELLANYKGQNAVERGFRFLKERSFRVSEVYLKKPSRILAMVMVLGLFIYSMTEFWLRRELERTGEMVTSQTEKQTQRPTLKWTFFLFRRVREFVMVVEDGRRLKRVTNMNEELGRSYGCWERSVKIITSDGGGVECMMYISWGNLLSTQPHKRFNRSE